MNSVIIYNLKYVLCELNGVEVLEVFCFYFFLMLALPVKLDQALFAVC